MLYIYFPIEDMLELPDEEKLHTIARLGARLVERDYKLLAHCGMGHNRSALVAGLILRYLGMSGDEVVSLLRERRQGALYNKAFAEYVSCVEVRPLQLELGAGI
jgi:protein-tyrosine phosphatase